MCAARLNEIVRYMIACARGSECVRLVYMDKQVQFARQVWHATIALNSLKHQIKSYQDHFVVIILN